MNYACFCWSMLLTVVQSACAIDYVTDIQPFFEEKCYSCHSVKEGKSKGSIEFDNLEDMEEIYIGPYTTMKPGNARESLLIELVSDPSSPDTMPPRDKGERLTSEEIQMLTKWIDEGAKVNPPKEGEKVEAAMTEWTSSDGRKVEGKFLGLEGDSVSLLIRGKKFSFAMSKLSEESQEQARKLAGSGF